MNKIILLYNLLFSLCYAILLIEGRDKKMLKLRIERVKQGRKHIAHFKDNKAIMHYDIIDKLVNKAIRFKVRSELIESIYDNGYIREDQQQ
jgi:hypothetical protein